MPSPVYYTPSPADAWDLWFAACLVPMVIGGGVERHDEGYCVKVRKVGNSQPFFLETSDAERLRTVE